MFFPKELSKYLKALYKEEDAQRIQTELEAYTSTLPILHPLSKGKRWYKSMQLYTVYPDAIIYDNILSPLQNLIKHISHIKKLHCNAVHILPFFESPMIDKGFDVSNYFGDNEKNSMVF